MAPQVLSPTSLVPHLKKCGYAPSLLAPAYALESINVPLAAFADAPHDVRSACIAVIHGGVNVAQAVSAVRSLGAPVVFACVGDELQWWRQSAPTPALIEKVRADQLPRFFQQHRSRLAPEAIFGAKTRGRLDKSAQLYFVDFGLMPLVEREAGARLSALVERVIKDIRQNLKRPIQSEADVNGVYKSTFWLLAAKVLHDKNVDKFKVIDLTDVDEVFTRVARHYDAADGLPPRGPGWDRALPQAATQIAAFSSLANISTEALAHVYENSLIPDEVRKALGTHSTPSSLVDYMVWQLWPWIGALDPDQRRVFEPGCGHAAFLVSAMRVLRQWSDITDGRARHEYLKKHLYGVEIDPFALEVARLSLTLADIPYGNRWDLAKADMFLGSTLEQGARRCGVLLANPPYERFTSAERAAYAAQGTTLVANTKACELLRRTLPQLQPGACFGVVMPQGFLHSTEGQETRELLRSDFELSEIGLFEDKLFEKGDHEAAVLLGRRKTRRASASPIRYRRVRNPGMAAFFERFAFSSEEEVNAAHIGTPPEVDFRVPELGAVWDFLKGYGKLKDIARVGQGLSHKGEELPKSAWTIHDPPHEGDDLGFAKVPGGLSICATMKPVGINLDPAIVRRYLSGKPTGEPQVLMNYAPVSRDVWKLKAVIDENGLALTSRFLAVRPRSPEYGCVYLWAILNSPVANAFAYTWTQKRDVLAGTMRQMPVPPRLEEHAVRIQQAAGRYRQLCRADGPLFDAAATEAGIRGALLETDAAVLRAYDLPPRLERQLLDLFQGVERKGVECAFKGYYPEGFTSYIPLHKLISDDFERSSADQVARRFQPGASAYVRDVLAAAGVAFGQE